MTISISIRRSLRWLAVSVFALLAVPSHAAVSVSGDCGSIIDAYGATGFGQVEGFYRVPPLAPIGAGPAIALQTGLDFGCSVGGNGTGQVLLTFDITNNTAAATPSITFYAKADVTGDDASFTDVPGATQAAGSREPNHWAIDDFLSGAVDAQINAGNLADATGNCSPDCDLVLGLQFGIGVLQPGRTGRIRLSLSDDGSVVSGTFLTASSTASPGQVFTLSGTVDVVPEPGTYALLLAGLGGVVVAAARRRRTARAAR